ncbi:2,3-bisphosphoglycerate-independent phosphoglycerate mutase [Ulvibacter litoralis]|uniref:2,3-bisphosphoglycerate-independent phosphoglycerate mutase n=1 Tax=Ulvibacter litoralis TaxID=227084 RepID=A0A1G7GHT9_9FLAO|nr:2,3-bisphosphoglycerate-independent phosphoglycerate mutase [Ulvibacter litoralis]GHC56108.1 2,3-bisphosphoglycerate-independent phosphoglycerate mutase [Ulvibacter litoralis]SDE87722.1 2,3-bisphosphoglycerate-independent phosphoglycerate mutase [Ulvibacter litoralis]
MNKKVLLLILDGWGVTQDPSVSAVAQANTPFIDSLYTKYPNAQLLTHGMNVGLPEGQMGNSEVGHMNLGAGRIVYQDLAKINLAVQNNTLHTEPVLEKAFAHAKAHNKKIHFLGLVSDGGVHSHINHLKGLLTAAHNEGLENVFVHAFTDGRDVDPKSGAGHIAALQEHMAKTTGKVASVVGRYFAMDRDKRWERVKKVYDLLVFGKGSNSVDAVKSIEESYANGVYDEFIEPIVITENNEPIATIAEDDVVIFFNFRTDRGRQLTEVITQKDYPDFGMKTIPLYFVTLTNYNDSYKGIHVVYNKENITNTLGEVLEHNHKTQIRIAETEKYPHVTFFFNGGRETPFEGEKRLLCPSPKVATYDLKPEMSAYDIRDKIIPEINSKSADFICLNFANPDMVGHTGVLSAAIKACETVDSCAKSIVEAALENGYTTLIIADHGNSETMQNPDGSPNTAHTTNPVPLIVVDPEIKKVSNGILGDIAPTILHLMGVEKPAEMDRNSLI